MKPSKGILYGRATLQTLKYTLMEMIPVRTGKWIYVIPLTAFAVLLFVSLTIKDAMHALFTKWSYYFILFMLLTWGTYIAIFLNKSSFAAGLFLARSKKGIIMALILTAITFLSVKPEFRVLSDETNLVSISKSFSENRSAVNVTMGKYYYDDYNSLATVVPKRPLVFPFLANILHTIFGYSVNNLYILNAMILFIFLCMTYMVSNRFLDENSALSSQFFVASVPIVAFSSTSAGFDMLSTLFFFLSLISLFLFMKHRLPEYFSVLWLNLLVFSNIRYESFIFFIVIMVGLLIFGYIRIELVKSTKNVIALTPLFFLPFYWQSVLSQGKFEAPPGTPVLGIGHFMNHTKTFLAKQLDFSFFLPYSNILHILAFVLLAGFLFEVARKKISFERDYQMHFAIFLLGALSLNLVIFLSHFLGNYDHPANARFFLVFAIACSLSPVFMKTFKRDIVDGKILLPLSVAVFLIYHPLAVEGRFMNQLTLPRDARMSYDFLEKAGEKNVMVIVDRPGQFTVFNYGAISFAHANSNKKIFINELERRLFSNIYVFQRITYHNGEPAKDYKLDSDYVLETVEEMQLTATEYLRISRVAPEKG